MHQLYDSRMENFKEWLTMAEQRLTQCAKPVRGHESLEEKKAIIQVCISFCYIWLFVLLSMKVEVSDMSASDLSFQSIRIYK